MIQEPNNPLTAPLWVEACVVIGEMAENVMLLNLGLMKIRLISASNKININTL